MDRVVEGNKVYTWAGAFLYSYHQNENIFIGALRFKGDNLLLGSKVANFVEIYGQRRPVAEIPKVTITFAPPLVNGRPAPRSSVVAIYPKGVPDYANTVVQDGKLVITIGNPVQRGNNRRIGLLENEPIPSPSIHDK